MKARIPTADELRRKRDVKLFMLMSVWVLNHKFGFGNKRLADFLEGWNDLMNEIDALKDVDAWTHKLEEFAGSLGVKMIDSRNKNG